MSDGLRSQARTRGTPLLAKLADLSDSEWEELADRISQGATRKLSLTGLGPLTIDRIDRLSFTNEAGADLFDRIAAAKTCPTCHRVIDREAGDPHPNSPGDHDPAYHVAKAYGTTHPTVRT